jgi:hypothetical protein
MSAAALATRSRIEAPEVERSAGTPPALVYA